MTDDIWILIHPERQALARDLEGIDAAAWSTPSLCPGWTVHQMLGHLTQLNMMTPPKFFANFAAAGFRFHVFNERQVAKYSGSSPSEALQRFRDSSNRRTTPPGPKPSWIGETVVHSEDIRRPLGITHTYDPEAVRKAADFYKTSDLLIGSKSRIAGVRLEATDADWSHGEGAVARGPLLSLLLAMTGRDIALADLDGDGAELLRSRT